MKPVERAAERTSAANERWIPIVDYAVLRGVSTSTLRRYIKARRIPYKIESGRYLLPADQAEPSRSWDGAGAREGASLFRRVRELERNLMQAQEQISELKMLVAIYEEKLAPSDC